MIFVTVGTSSYDPLIEMIDQLVGKGLIIEKVIAQIGHGKYEPKNITFFKLAKSLDKLINAANVVITTGGAGTVFECLKKNKKIVAVENENVSNSHQGELLYKLHKDKHIIWCRDMSQMPDYLRWYETHTLEPFCPEQLDFELVLLELFAKDENSRPWWKFWR